MINDPRKLISPIKNSLIKKIEAYLEATSKFQDVEEVKSGMRNLYAIIFDTTTHNWFLDFQDEASRNNGYSIIYNLDLLQTSALNNNIRLFDKMIAEENQYTLNFNL